MKHTFQVSLIVILMFFLAQLIGLAAVDSYRDTSYEDGLKPLPAGIERPDVDEQITPWLMITGVLIGTMLVFLLIKLNAGKAWSIWFGLSIFMLSIISLYAFLPISYALVLSLIFVFIKTSRMKMHWIIKNIPELFIYSGLAIIFAPLLTFWGAVILLLLISLYDMYAVWQSKHMVKLARFQLDSGKFAGLSVAYDNPSTVTKEEKSNNKINKELSSSKTKKTEIKNSTAKLAKKEKVVTDKATSGKKSAILGGGDVAFPLLFSATLLYLIGWNYAIASTLGATMGLGSLLFLSVKDRYYPAMPFISAGCFLGIGVLWILALLI